MRPNCLFIHTVTFSIALFLSAAASADLARDRSACLDAMGTPDERLAACGRLAANEAASREERREAYYRRGLLNYARRKYREAVADLDAAEKLGMDAELLYRRRGYSQSRLKRWQAAIADYTAAIERNPKHAWTYYARAFSHSRLRQYDLAKADLDRAVALSPRNTVYLESRGRLFLRLKDDTRALADFDRMLRLRPRYARGYLRRGRVHERLKNRAGAIHDYRMAGLLDPNIRVAAPLLKRVVGKVPAPPGGALPFAAPEKGRRYLYVQLQTTAAARKSEMEESIDALAGWFKRKKLPLPKRVSFLERRIKGTEDRTVEVRVRILHRTRRQRRIPPQTVRYYRALWPTLLPTGRGPEFDVDYPAAALDKLWPLEVGKKAAGEGTVFILCPKTLNFGAAMIGCKKDTPDQKIRVGTVTWTAAVVKWETVTVPAGVIPAIVVSYRETQALKILNKSRTEKALVYFWYAPGQRWWVRRTGLRGKEVSIVELMSVD